MISLDNFKRILEEVGAVPCEGDDSGFYRSLLLKKFDNKIIFTWHINNCSATINNDIEICFYDDIQIEGCWPNGYKTNINLKFRGSVVCVIPLEEYES